MRSGLDVRRGTHPPKGLHAWTLQSRRGYKIFRKNIRSDHSIVFLYKISVLRVRGWGVKGVYPQAPTCDDLALNIIGIQTWGYSPEGSASIGFEISRGYRIFEKNIRSDPRVVLLHEILAQRVGYGGKG